jgi:protease I
MKLKGKKIAILATNGFEHSELFEPLKALKDEGATVDIVSLEKGEIKSWEDKNWGESIKVDKVVDAVSSKDYDGLVLPGGVINPDLLRVNEKAVSFVRSFFNGDKTKPTAAICHGPWMLVEAGVVRGRNLTSYKSIKTDLKNAGANWSDEEVVVDKGLVTSRSPDDLKAFNKKMIEEFAEGVHANLETHAPLQ